MTVARFVAWLADAARRTLRAEGLLRVVAEWEEQHGEITNAELTAVSRRASAAGGARKTGRQRGRSRR